MFRWLILGANFYIQFITYGLVYSFGVFIPVISTFYAKGIAETAWIGSLSSGFTMLSGILASSLTIRFGYRTVVIVGSVIASLGLLTCTLVEDMYILYFTFGIMFGVGAGLMAAAGVISVVDYFPDKRSFALGVTCSGASFGISVYPNFLTYLFEIFTWKMSLLVISGLVMNGIVCGAILVPIQTPKRMHDNAGSDLCSSENIFRNFGFNCYTISAFIYNAGYFIVIMLLPDYSQSLGLSDTNSSILIACQGVASIVSRVFFGWIADKSFVNIHYLNAILPFIGGVLVIMMMFVKDLLPLVILTTCFGFFTAPFSSLIASSLIQVVGKENLAQAYGACMFSSGSGSMIGPPLGGLIKDSTRLYAAAFYISSVFHIVSAAIILLLPVSDRCAVQRKAKNENKTQRVFSLDVKV